MSKGRLEAFSDGVIAILITIMVLEFHVPEGVAPAGQSDWVLLSPIWHKFSAYVLSFVFLGIYWNNHHHMFHATDRTNGTILWANLHLLFWLSLVPFTTAWMGTEELRSVPTALYGGVLLMAAIAYVILQMTIIAQQGPESKLHAMVKDDMKGKVSVLLYIAAIPLAFVNAKISIGLYILVALIWFVPDRRIESQLSH